MIALCCVCWDVIFLRKLHFSFLNSDLFESCGQAAQPPLTDSYREHFPLKYHSKGLCTEVWKMHSLPTARSTTLSTKQKLQDIFPPLVFASCQQVSLIVTMETPLLALR